MNPSAHHKLKQLQVDFQKKVNLFYNGYFETNIVSFLCAPSQNYAIATHLTIKPQCWWSANREFAHSLDRLTKKKNPFTSEAQVLFHENKQWIQQNDLSYAIHSLNNLPACVIQRLCWMYSISEIRDWQNKLSFCHFLSRLFWREAYTHNQRTKQNHVTPKNSVAHHLLPAMQHVNHITIYN